MKTIFLTLFSVAACGSPHKEKEAQPSSKTEELRTLFNDKKVRAEAIRDKETNWLTRLDCDSFLWNSKYASAVEDVDMLLAEYTDSPGKFGRRPPPWCWTPDGGDQGSATTWSRDMAAAGLLPWAWLKGKLAVLERHAAYGASHSWQMGEPSSDLAVYYTPQIRGLLAKEIIGLGGAASAEALWPSVWPAGLADYEAHLQVMNIWLQGAIAAKLQDADAIPRRDDGAVELTDISDSMYRRLEEHATREPQNPLYQYVLAKYRDGNQAQTLELLLDPAMPLGSYVRCADLEHCRLAEWLFVAHLLLADYPQVEFK